YPQSSPTLMSINTPASSPQASSPPLHKEESQHSVEAAYSTQRMLPEKPSVEENFVDASGEGRHNGDKDSDRSVPDQVEVMEARDTSAPEPVQKAADNAVLLDIVKSL